MTISEMIRILSEIKSQYGDLNVTNLDSEPNDGDDPGYSIDLHFDIAEVDLVLGINAPITVSDYKLNDLFTRITGIKPTRLKIISSPDVFIRPFPERRNIK